MTTETLQPINNEFERLEREANEVQRRREDVKKMKRLINKALSHTGEDDHEINVSKCAGSFTAVSAKIFFAHRPDDYVLEVMETDLWNKTCKLSKQVDGRYRLYLKGRTEGRN